MSRPIDFRFVARNTTNLELDIQGRPWRGLSLAPIYDRSVWIEHVRVCAREYVLVQETPLLARLWGPRNRWESRL